jgi:hypothetical protein
MVWRYFLVLILLLSCSSLNRNPAQVDPSQIGCSDGLVLFSAYVDKTHKDLFKAAIKIRSKNQLTDARVGHTFKVNGRNYKFISLLGKSHASVYLARNEAGELVSVKMDSLVARVDDGLPNWLARTWWYEKFKTKFYESLKLPVAHIVELDATSESPVIVKEYIFGLTYDEIKENKGLFSPGVAPKIMFSLMDTMYNFRAVEEKFLPWIADNFFDPARSLNGSALEETKNLMGRGDVAERNFVYDVVREKWVCIDP